MKADRLPSSAQYPGRSSAAIKAKTLKNHPHSLLSGLIKNLDLILKGVSPNQHKHSAAIREDIEKIEQRLEEAVGKIQNLEERFQAARDESAAARAETKLAQEATRAATKRAEEAIREINERSFRIAALERRLKLNIGNSHQPTFNNWPPTPKKPPRQELADFERQEGRGAAGTPRGTSKV